MQAILQKLASALFTIWLAVTLAFFSLRILPGDAITAQLSGSGQPQSVIDQRKALYNLDKPLIQQYGIFLLNLLQGDLGMSLYGGQTVNEIIFQRYLSTLSLATSASLIAVGLGLLLGIFGGLSFGIVSRFARWITDISFGVPIYWTATLVVFVFAIRIGGTRDNLLLPALVLGFHSAGGIARIAQTNIRDVQNATFVRTAYGKGLQRITIIHRHILSAALLPIITVIALQMGILFSGTVITEAIFQRAGLGLLLLDAILERNYPVVQGVVIITVMVYVTLNTMADMLYTVIDPRVQI